MHNPRPIRVLAACLAVLLQFGVVEPVRGESIGFQRAPVIYAQLVERCPTWAAPSQVWQSRLANSARDKSFDATLRALSVIAVAPSEGFSSPDAVARRPVSGEARAIPGRSPPGVLPLLLS
jgi:hypothetical protein